MREVSFPSPRGTAGRMHHLGYELPERTGFGGLWSAMDEPGGAPVASVTVERHVVARSAGAGSPAVQARLAAFRAALAELEVGAEDVAA